MRNSVKNISKVWCFGRRLINIWKGQTNTASGKTSKTEMDLDRIHPPGSGYDIPSGTWIWHTLRDMDTTHPPGPGYDTPPGTWIWHTLRKETTNVTDRPRNGILQGKENWKDKQIVGGGQSLKKLHNKVFEPPGKTKEKLVDWRSVASALCSSWNKCPRGTGSVFLLFPINKFFRWLISSCFQSINWSQSCVVDDFQ